MKRLLLSLFTLLVVPAAPAAAQPLILGPLDFLRVLPGVGLTHAKQGPPWVEIETARKPLLGVSSIGFRLVMSWDGTDDPEWPFTKILDRLSNHVCGGVADGWAAGMLDRLYKSQSLTPEVKTADGMSFSKKLSGTVGRCRVEMATEGARWNALMADVSVKSP